MTSVIHPPRLSERYTHALTAARRGWSVIPVGSDKKPLLRWEPYQHTPASEGDVERWWAQWPDANVGIVTGKISKLVIVDIDSWAGEQAFLDREHGAWPDTPQVQTGKGRHLYFTHPGHLVPCRNRILDGVDLKGDGGYVVGVGSRHANGTDYTWKVSPEDTLVAPMPAWVLEALKTSAKPIAPSGGAILNGERNHTLWTTARGLRLRGLSPEAIEAAVRAENGARCSPPLPEIELSRLIDHALTHNDRPDFLDETVNGKVISIPVPRSCPWDAAQSARDFIEHEDPEPTWIEYPFLAREAVTEWFAPRGLGKTHVAHALAVKVARRGLRVLLIDRDNPRRETRRRLKGWGADAAGGFKVITRETAPPLTDASAWAAFPYAAYDVVIIDSLDSSTEGVGEQDSSKPSRALAPLIDLAHRENGPAVLLLGNTIKSGQHGRGSGIVEDRADICFEVRDATSFQPTGKKDWWMELPEASTAAWASRASRRGKQEKFRLAFIPSKFRVGEEPAPLLLEYQLPDAAHWVLEDVTRTVTSAAAEAHQHREALPQAAAQALHAELLRREQAGNPPMLAERDAVPFLTLQGLSRDAARQLVGENEDKLWSRRQEKGQQGQPVVLVPLLAPSDPVAEPAAETNVVLNPSE